MKTFITRYKIIFRISGIASIVLIAILLSSIKGGFLFPSLGDVVIRLCTLFGDVTFLSSFFNSLIKLIITLCVSFVLALFLSYLRAIKKETSSFFEPFLVFLKCSPLAILSVYLFLLFGGEMGPYYVIFSIVFPLLVEAFFTSQDEISPQIQYELKITNVSRSKKYFKIILPLMWPYISMSFLMTFGLGLKGTLMGEYLMQSQNSLGEYIYILKTNLDIVTLLAVLLFCIIFTLCFEILARFVFKIVKTRLS